MYDELIAKMNPKPQFNLDWYPFNPDDRTLVAREENLYEDLICNHVFEFFANSFLVECTEQGGTGGVTFSGLSCKRLPEYQIGTRFRKKQ